MCNYDNIEDKLKESIDKQEMIDYDIVILSDLNISKEIAIKYYETCSRCGKLFYIVDHHKKSIDNGLNELDFADIYISKGTKLTCGVELIYDLYVKLCGKSNYMLEEYIEIVRQYDTWDWMRLNNNIPKKWNMLYYIISKEDFCSRVLAKISKGNLSFEYVESEILEIEENRKDMYIKQKIKTIEKIKLDGYNCAVVFAEQYINELAEKISNDNSIDIVIILGANTISFRTEKMIDVNEIAKKYGGGGHSKAAGATISKEAKDKYIKEVLKLK